MPKQSAAAEHGVAVDPRRFAALHKIVSILITRSDLSKHYPARFAFAHGGKDGHPYRVDRKTYDQSIEILRSQLRDIRPGSDNRPNAGVLREVVQGLLELGSEETPGARGG